jgi:heme A synthase
VFYHHRRRLELSRPAFFLVMLLSMQVTLGAFVVWSSMDPVINTAHVVNGALVLGTSVVLTLRSFRSGFERLVQPIHQITRSPNHQITNSPNHQIPPGVRP